VLRLGMNVLCLRMVAVKKCDVCLLMVDPNDGVKCTQEVLLI
jgi:hypothetical protein